jgi:hypothetical protein
LTILIRSQVGGQAATRAFRDTIVRTINECCRMENINWYVKSPNGVKTEEYLRPEEMCAAALDIVSGPRTEETVPSA